MELEEKIVNPNDVIVTFVHNEDNASYINAREYLRKQETSKIEPIILALIEDKFYVYDGNKRVRGAKENQHSLKSKIIKDESEFNEFLKTGKVCWFGISNFEELKKIMKMYGEYPHEKEKMPEEYMKVINPLAEAQRIRHENQRYEQMKTFFPFDDDD